MVTRKLKLVTKQPFLPEQLDCTSLLEKEKEFRPRDPGVIRDSTFRDVEAHKILLSIESLHTNQDIEKFNGLSHAGKNNIQMNENSADKKTKIAQKIQQNTNKELDRLAEKIIRQSWRMNLTLSNSTFRFGCSSCAQPLPNQFGDFVPGYALHRNQAIPTNTINNNKRLQNFIDAWITSKDPRFTLRSRAVSVSNYKYNPENLRARVKGLLEALSLNENQDLACIEPAFLCHQVAQAALNSCRLANLKSTISSVVDPPTPAASPARAKSPTSRIPKAASPTAKEGKRERFGYLRALGAMPEGVLARLSESGSWDAALYRVEDNGDLVCVSSDGLSEEMQPRSVCSLSAGLRSVQEMEGAAAHFPFQLRLSCAGEEDGGSGSPGPGAQARLPASRVITLSALSAEDRQRWLAAARLFIAVPQILDISEYHDQQEQQHLLAQRAERMLKRKSAPAPPPTPAPPPPRPARDGRAREGARLPQRPCSAIPPHSSPCAAAPPMEVRLPVRRPASAAL